MGIAGGCRDAMGIAARLGTLEPAFRVLLLLSIARIAPCSRVGDRTGLDEADEVRERSRLKALFLAACRRLREREANRPDRDLVRRHRRAAVVPPWTPRASGCAAGVPVMKPAEAG